MWRNVKTCILVVLAGTGSLWAIDPLPKEPGFSGYVLFGGGVVSLENNMIAGNKLISVGEERISSLFEAPESDSSAAVTLNFDLRYTFSNLRTQLFWGNRLEDFLRFDTTVGIGVRQKLGKSLVEIALIQAPLIFTEVWSDPYVVGVDRQETDVDMGGARLTWERIGGSGLALRVLFRDIDLDDEDSASTLGLTSSQRALLNREGDALSFTALYAFKFSDRHTLAPEIQYHDQDLDGAAMAYDGYQAQLSYLYRAPRASVVIVLSYGEYENKAVNPIYGMTDEFDRFAINVTTFFDLFKKQPTWNAYVLLAHGDSDHDIEFYDSEATTVSVGAMYRF